MLHGEFSTIIYVASGSFTMSSKKPDDLDMMQDIVDLPDDLYLEDVGGGDKPSKKYAGWVNSRSMGSRGRGRAKKHGGFNHVVEDDLLDVGEQDLNSLENWDLDDELYAEMEGEVSKKPPFRSRSQCGRVALLNKTQLKRGVDQRPYRGKDYESSKSPEDIFDIESKSRQHKFNWNREGDYVQEEPSWRSGESAEQDGNRRPSYVAQRKLPPRIAKKLAEAAENKFGPSRNDPRLKASNISRTNTTVNVYAPARKDPRLVPQQALMHRQQSSKPRTDSHLDALRKNIRLSSEKNPTMDLAPPGVEELEESVPSSKQEAVTRRGPRSPSLPSPLRISGDQSLSPSSRHGRPFRERSLSPHSHGIHRNSLSPHRREWQNSSRDRRSLSRSPSRRISTSPRSRHQCPKEWSGSPRRDRSRDESQSGRQDRSLSPWRTRSPFSPSRHSSLSSSRDESWRQSPSIGSMMPRYGHVQQQPPPQQSYEVIGPPPPPPPPPLTTATNVYNEGNYSGSAPTAPAYNAPPAPPPAYSNYQQYGYDNYYQQQPLPPSSYPGEYAPPAQQPPSWTDGGMVYPDVSQPPPVQIASVSGTGPAAVAGGSSQPAVDQKSEEAKKEAVKNEMIQQKQTLSKQREEYVRKKALIAHELQLLREQEEDLLEENSRDNDRILKENNKLQMEIQNKLKAINNVIDMLTGIIGDKDQQDVKKIGKASHKDPDKVKSDQGDLEDAASKRLSRATCNFVHYDPEMHWCRVCDVFPRTAKEYLNHLHSIEHKEETLERKLVDMPWHKIQPDQEILHIPGAPTKRTPIRGTCLQFFISATAWYCKLCDTWIGDLHCASLHLKSKRHTENYSKFTEQNPHWETDWIADRQRAYEQYSEKLLRVKEENKQLPPVVEQTLVPSLLVYGKNIKPEQKEDKYEPKLKKMKSKEQRKKMKKNCLTALDETKKKKRHKKQKSKKLHGSLNEGRSSSSNSGSSSSSSSSEGDSEAENGDKSKSIRVAMRNKAKEVNEQIPLLPRSRWDSPPEQKPDVEELDEKIKHSIDVRIGTGDDKLIREWMTSSKDVSDGEKLLLNSIKDRLKQKQEADKERERERRDDKRDSRRGRRRSDSPSSPSYRSKRSRSDKSPDDRRERSTRFDRYERYDSFHKSPERPTRRDSSSKIDQKFKEEPDVKFPERKSDQEKKIMVKLEEEEEDDDESAESKFEKQTAESAAKLMKKSKKPAVLAVPKSKLPFIGRMPILKHFAKKKKPEDKSEGEECKQPTEDPLVQAQYKLEFTNVGGKVHIGPQESSTAKGSGIVGPENLKISATAQPTEHEVQDMEIDEDSSNSDTPPPTIETPVIETAVQLQSPKKPLNDIPLPKDFQDALNILFPGQDSFEKKEEVCAPSSGVIQSGPKPPSMPPTNHQGHWPSATGPQMMSPMQNFGGSSQGPSQMIGGGGPMMGPMHGMQGPTHPAMQGPPQGPQGMYVPPYGLHVQGSMMAQPHPTNIMQKNEPPLRHPSLPAPKEKKTPPSKVGPSKKEIAVRKSDVAGEMSADELAMMGIDVGDMAAQSF
ncbi:hypothetical protein C0J52_11112 [Blattella germanica]|nr:hypothetical protein C0J52_11112 [Blattella germanica]